jgi:hypothetical protein
MPVFRQTLRAGLIFVNFNFFAPDTPQGMPGANKIKIYEKLNPVNSGLRPHY